MQNQIKQKKLQYNNIEDALQELNAQDRGRYFLCTCPECDKNEAFIYKNNLAFIQCNRENYCGERMSLEYREKISEKDLEKQQLREEYPEMSIEQLDAMDWAVRSFHNLKTHFKSFTLKNGYRGLSEETTKDYIVDFSHKEFTSFMFQKIESLIGKDYSMNDWMSKRNLVFPIYGQNKLVDRVLLRSSIDADIEPKEIQLIINPSKDTRDFFVDISDKAETVVISESIIDALSFRELNKDIGIIALTGASKTRKVSEYIKQNKDMFQNKDILLAMDNDIAGEKATEKLITIIKDEKVGRGYNLFQYDKCKDANDFLMNDREGFEITFEKSLKHLNQKSVSLDYER